MGETNLIDIFLVIFIGMGPVKVLFVYMGVTKGASREVKRRVARTAIVTAVIVALVLLLLGAIFMQILHFSEGALTIAGGIILLILALRIVLDPGEADEPEGGLPEEQLMRMAIYPLAIPLLLNPVGIVALTIFSAEAQELWQFGVLAGMVVVVGVIDYLVFLGADRLDPYLSHSRIMVLEKLLGILLAALAVQLVLNGLEVLGLIRLAGH
jgi:multiple antibiotic resistance protein